MKNNVMSKMVKRVFSLLMVCVMVFGSMALMAEVQPDEIIFNDKIIYIDIMPDAVSGYDVSIENVFIHDNFIEVKVEDAGIIFYEVQPLSLMPYTFELYLGTWLTANLPHTVNPPPSVGIVRNWGTNNIWRGTLSLSRISIRASSIFSSIYAIYTGFIALDTATPWESEFNEYN